MLIVLVVVAAVYSWASGAVGLVMLITVVDVVCLAVINGSMGFQNHDLNVWDFCCLTATLNLAP